jgi:hypothetical protein
MTRTTVVTNARSYTVSGLEPRARGGIFQAIVTAQVVDALTGAPVQGARMTTTTPGLRSGVAPDGFAGLAGMPSRVFPALDSTAYQLDVVVRSTGYAPRHEVAPFVVQPGFPDAFSPFKFGVLPMHRDPVAVRIGTYGLNPSNRPVALPGATVDVTGHWVSLDQLGVNPTTTPLLAISPGLSVRRPAGTTVMISALAVAVEAPRTLRRAADAGSTRIEVTNVGGLVVGNVIGLDRTDPERVEHIEVTAINGPADTSAPAELELRYPLAWPHREGANAVRIPVPWGAPGPVALIAETLEGDRTLRVNTLGGIAPGQFVRISGGGSVEYRTAGHYSIVTNAEGAGRFPPLSGVAAVRVKAQSGGLDATARLTLTQMSPAVDLTLK